MTSALKSLIFQTRLKPDSISSYEQIHASIPFDLEEDIRGAGCEHWEILRTGTLLTHLLLVHDGTRLFDALDHSIMHREWQKIIEPLLDPAPLVILEKRPENAGVLVWQLPARAS